VTDYLFAIALLICGLLAVGWVVRRDLKRASHWGNQEGQSSILTGAQTDAPQFFPTEPVEGPSVNGAEVDEISHERRQQDD